MSLNPDDNSFESSFTKAAQASAQPPAETAPDAAAAPASPPDAPQTHAPVEPTVSASTPASEPSPAPAQVPSHIRELARSSGFDVPEDASYEDVLRLATQRVQQVSAYAQIGQQMLAQQQAQAPAAEPEAPEEFDPSAYFQQHWNQPKWDPQYDALIKVGAVEQDDQTGLWKPTPGYETLALPLISGMNQAAQAKVQNWRSFMERNPYEDIYQKVSEPLQKRWLADIEAAIEKRFADRERKNYAKSFEESNASWLYVGDTDQLTPKGQEFLGHVQTLRRGGMTDERQLLEIASKLSGIGQQQQAHPAPAAAVPAQQQVQAAAPAAQQTVPFLKPVPSQAQQQEQSFMQEALSRASHTPQSNGGSGYDPGEINSSELENLFVNNFRASRGTRTA